MTFLAAESGTRLCGITWDRRLLLPGEAEAITAQTLLWHLDGFNAALVQDLFTAPCIRPLALLPAALRADGHGLGPAREATRRRTGMGGAQRRERARREKLALTGAPDQSLRPIPGGKPANRFSLSRLLEGCPASPAPVQPRVTWPETVRVYIVLGWGPKHGRIGWQRRSGYNRRGLVEITMFRYETIIGRRLQASGLTTPTFWTVSMKHPELRDSA